MNKLVIPSSREELQAKILEAHTLGRRRSEYVYDRRQYEIGARRIADGIGLSVQIHFYPLHTSQALQELWIRGFMINETEAVAFGRVFLGKELGPRSRFSWSSEMIDIVADYLDVAEAYSPETLERMRNGTPVEAVLCRAAYSPRVHVEEQMGKERVSEQAGV